MKTFLPYTNYWSEVLPCDVEKIENIFIHVILINQNRVHCKRTKSTLYFILKFTMGGTPKIWRAKRYCFVSLMEERERGYSEGDMWRRDRRHFDGRCGDDKLGLYTCFRVFQSLAGSCWQCQLLKNEPLLPFRAILLSLSNAWYL